MDNQQREGKPAPAAESNPAPAAESQPAPRATAGPLPSAVTGPTAVLHSISTTLRQAGLPRLPQLFLHVNQPNGFDCPSCAWPDPAPGHQHTFEFCENGAKAFADEATRQTIGAEFFARHTLAELRAQSDHWLNAQGRLAQPLLLRSGASHYTPISWDAAFARIADEMRAMASPHEAVFYTSGRTSNEAAFVYQLLARRFGTNNLPDCSNMCHESSGMALTETLGLGKSTVTLEDLENAPCILVIGQNPATNHPRMLTSLERAARRGARIISINPLREPGLFHFRQPQAISGWLGSGTPLTSLFLQVRINGDLALLQALGKLILEKGLGDAAFLRDYTEGFPAYADHLRSLSLDSLLAECGVPLAQLREAAQTIGEAEGVVACWAMGLTQHHNAVATIRELVNLMLLTGNIGKPRAGLFCVRGHSNVQGDRTMGILERPKPAFLQALQKEFGFSPPSEPGLNTVATIAAMAEGHVRLFFAMGGNFLSAAPDTPRVAAGLARCRLTVSVATKLNRTHLHPGQEGLLLPCLARTDLDLQAGQPQFVTTENSISVVGRSRGLFPPPSPELRSEVAIVCGVAQALWPADGDATTSGGATVGTIDWPGFAADYRRIRRHIARVIPGFADFEERLAEGSFALEIPPARRIFPTSSGKARLTVNTLRPQALRPGELLLATLRSHDQFNTTVYGLDDRYRGIRGGRRVVFLRPQQIEELGFHDGELVDLHSAYQGQQRTVEGFQIVGFDLPMRCAAAYFPETNPLIPADQFAEGSHTPISKSVVIRITRSQPSGEAAFDPPPAHGESA